MTEQERGLIFLCSLLGPIPFVWFITAKFTYGINSETAHYLVPYLLKNTFNLWPLWAAIIAGVVIGLCGFIGFIIYDKGRVYKGPRFKRILRWNQISQSIHTSRKNKGKR